MSMVSISFRVAGWGLGAPAVLRSSAGGGAATGGRAWRLRIARGGRAQPPRTITEGMLPL